MKISRHIPIMGRIIREDDIRRLIAILEAEYSLQSAHSKTVRFLFKLYSNDETIFETDNSSEFLATEFLQTKRIISFELSLSDFSQNLGIEISLSHDCRSYRHGIFIRGTDTNWVNSLSLRLKEAVEAFAPQNLMFSKYKRPIEIVSAFGFGQLYKWLFSLMH